MKLGLIVAVALAAAFFGLTAPSAAAIDGTLRIESKTAVVGQTVSVDLLANVGPPGLGAWTVDVSYDTDQLSMDRCLPYEGGVCSTAFSDDTGRATGASRDGLVGETRLVAFYFQCAEDPGVSDIRLSVEVFADATPDAPADITEDVTEGEITCVEPLTHYGTLEVESRTMLVGETGRIIARARDIPEPGLAAWTFDIGYDASIVSVDECLGLMGVGGEWRSVCSLDVSPDTIRVTGASSNVSKGDWLASIHFKCERAGRSTLPISIEVWANSTVAVIGQDPPPPEVIEGSIMCLEPETPSAPVLPPTGSGSGRSLMPRWPMAALVAFGTATMVGSAVVRKRGGLP